MTTSISTQSRPRRIWEVCWRLVVSLAVIYCGLCVMYVWHQDRHLFPGQVTQGKPDRIVQPSADYDLVHFTIGKRDEITAIFGSALDAEDRIRPDAAARPTIIYFNGNGSTISGDLDEFHAFRRIGCNVLIPDYPGYGMSGGYASEREFYACADAAYDYAIHRHDVDPTQIVSMGWSLGAAVATDLAAHRPVMALAVLSGFTSWPKQFGERALWRPASVFLRARFDTEAKFATLRCPVFIAHGVHDPAIPFSMAQQLAAVRGVVPLAIDSGHEILDTRRTEVMGAISQFINSCSANRKTVQ